MSGGWSPVIHLASQAGAKAEWNERLQAFLPPKEAEGWVGAGGFNGDLSPSKRRSPKDLQPVEARQAT